jgi:hypothetical protein
VRPPGAGAEKKERSERRELVGGTRADSGKHFAREDERQRPREIRRSGAHSRRGCPSRRLQLQGPTTSSGSSSLADKRQPRCVSRSFAPLKLMPAPAQKPGLEAEGLAHERTARQPLGALWAHDLRC